MSSIAVGIDAALSRKDVSLPVCGYLLISFAHTAFNVMRVKAQP
uniref:Uncharacterized protein n=2 Tax=Klebsiella/Raoultella group TaxID=2890311 RepID=A0A2R4PI54_KLEPN|nr:hypothetical protein [Klebsiella pneumoniae]QNL32495.1 Hypothetical protein [Raoultella ornithinolytica]QZX60455.1 hypothetical protein [Klebsiella michiganensis]UFD96826.1 hypothetical protein [Klebsiella oxytoca]QID23594.1 hypothetical protein [Klebsiella pneumoniae]